jgi:hypothetical protein
MARPLGDDDDIDAFLSKALQSVKLDFFKAQPNKLLPFETSTLSWRVIQKELDDEEDGPANVKISLDGVEVAMAGSRTIAPESTRDFLLYASVKKFGKFQSKLLGRVTVNVDFHACLPILADPIVDLLSGLLALGIQLDDTLYFRQIRQPDGTYRDAIPEVSVSDGAIRFSLKLASKIDWFQDFDVDIDASFGLGIVEDMSRTQGISVFEFIPRKIVEQNVQATVSVAPPFYLWPFGGPVLALAIAMNETTARKEVINTTIPKLVSAIVNVTRANLRRRLIALNAENQRMEPRSIRIFNAKDDEQDLSNVETTFCPVLDLRVEVLSETSVR